MPQMELLALIAIGLMSLVGWVIATECLGKWIDHGGRFYFAPALGMAACAIIAYVSSATRQTWLIRVFAVIALLAFFRCIFKKQLRGIVGNEAQRIFRLTLLIFLCLYGIQISLFHFFKTIYPGTDEVWDLFNLTGVSPPDQMFAWHQAMFADLHRHYPQDPFYGESDLYDRPHLGGYLTLFFFKLFRLRLAENHYTYPVMSLRFYHCLWWLLNNLYLFGIAPLFQRLLGYRGAVLAIASTALSGFILLCNAGGWMKFSAYYPFLLAFLLFLNGKNPLLQAGLCATSYYLHGSVLPFLVGFGLFQILCVYYPIRPRLVRPQEVLWFGAAGVLVIGAWFAVVHWVGSKQPLFYYYIYDAGLTQAQTQSVAEIAKQFYARYTWSTLSLLPLHNLVNSVVPVHFLTFLRNIFTPGTSLQISGLASAIFESQRLCILSAVGLAALPLVLIGITRTLAIRYAGRTVLALYLIPTLLMALVYRIHWSFSLHIMCLYHAFVLFLWVSVLRNARLLFVAVCLVAIAFEGIICVLFSEMRFLPVHGLELNQITPHNFIYLAAYLGLLLVIFVAACWEMRRTPLGAEATIPNEPREETGYRWLLAGRKLLVGVLITGLAIAAYSLYCRQFY
jgi:hypothetical protein